MRWWEIGLPGYDDEQGTDTIRTPDDEQPSIMRLLLSDDDAERLEIEPGRWYLPGTPP
jgi:hypothetical protein